MKAFEVTNLIAKESNLTIGGKEKKPIAYGTMFGYPVVVYTRSLGLFGKQLKVDFGISEYVKPKELAKVVYSHKAKDKFFIQEYESNDLTGAMIAGAVGGVGGVLLGDPQGKGEVKERALLGNQGMFTVLLTLGGISEQDLIIKYREIMSAVEASLKQMGLNPPVFEGES